MDIEEIAALRIVGRKLDKSDGMRFEEEMSTSR